MKKYLIIILFSSSIFAQDYGFRNNLRHDRNIILDRSILVNDNIALFYVEIVDSNGINLAFEWVVEKVLTEGIYKNCWMTVSVSTPIKFGNSA